MGLFPDLPKFCYRLSPNSAPSCLKVLSPAVEPSVLSLAVLSFYSQLSQNSVFSYSKILSPVVPRSCPQLFQDSVPSWAKVLSLAMSKKYFFCLLSQQPFFLSDSTPAVQCILTLGSCGPWVVASWALTSSGSSEKTGNRGWHLPLAEASFCQESL